jgi:hypothetical protein
MIFPSFKRLVYTDFPQQFQTLVDQMSYTINNSFESIFDAMANGISIRDNLQATVVDVNVTVDSTGAPLTATSFKISNSNPIDGTQVIRAVPTQNGSTSVPSSGVMISYSQTGSKVTISNITGIPANVPFSVRVIAYLTT